jgi:hypothetical protein
MADIFDSSAEVSSHVEESVSTNQVTPVGSTEPIETDSRSDADPAPTTSAKSESSATVEPLPSPVTA